MKKKLLLALATIFLSTMSSAENMTNLLAEAMSSDTQYLEAKQKAYALAEGRWQGASGLLPRLDLTANSLWNDQKKQVEGQTKVLAGKFNSNEYTLKLTQSLIDIDKLLGLQKGLLQEGYAEIKLLQAWNDLAIRLLQSYFDVLYAQDVLKSYELQREANVQFLDLATRSFRIGVVTVNDVLEAESRLELVKAQLLQAELDFTNKKKVLFVILGREVKDLKSISQDVRLSPLQPDDKEQWLRLASIQNLDILAQRLEVSLADTDLMRSKAAHLPTLNLVGSYNPQSQSASLSSGISSDPGPGWNTTESYVGVQLQLPILQGGYVLSKTRELGHTLYAQQDKLTTTMRKTEESVEQNYSGMLIGLAKINTLRSGLELSRKSLKATQIGYSVGVRTATDILNMQQQIASASRDLARASYDTLFTQFRLKSLVSNLTVDDFASLNTIFR
jgi:outer membrane protein